jgi:hypothetical protein
VRRPSAKPETKTEADASLEEEIEMRAIFNQNQLSDQIALFSDATKLMIPAFSVIDRLQMGAEHVLPGEQILGTAVALIAMCESANVSLSDVMAKARNVMADVEGPFTAHIRAVRDYAKYELLGGGR